MTELTSSVFEANRLDLSATEQMKSNPLRKAANSNSEAMIKIHAVDETFYPRRWVWPVSELNHWTHLCIPTGGVMDRMSLQSRDHATMPSRQSRCRRSNQDFETKFTHMMHTSTLAQLNQRSMKDIMFSISLTKWINLRIRTCTVLVVLSSWQLNNVLKQALRSRVRPCHWPMPYIKPKLQLIDSRET